MTENKCRVVSDMHIGAESDNQDTFIDFIDNLGNDVDHLVLPGDILDFQRREPGGVLLEHVDIFVQRSMRNRRLYGGLGF